MNEGRRNSSGKVGASRSGIARYGVALIAPLCVALVMQLTWPLFEQTPVSLFLLSVMLSAWYGGLRAGLVTVFFSSLIADYFFIQPYLSLGLPRWADVVYLGTLLLVGSFISVLTELMQRAARRSETNLAFIRKSEDRYRALVGTISQIIWNTDPHGRVTGDIPAWREITGQAIEDVSGHGWINALNQNDQVQLRRLWARASEDKKAFEGEVSLLQKDGTSRYYVIRGVPIFGEDGSTIQEWFMTASDIQERKRAEKQFSEVVEGAPNGMVVVDGRGMITLVNAQIESSFGYTRVELLGRPIEMLVPERFRPRHPSYRESFVSEPAARPMGAGRDLFGLRKDGTEFPVEIGLNPLQTEQGVLVLGTIVDITERKQAEEKVRRSQEQLAGIIASAMDAIITIDEEQQIVLFNAAAERMFLFAAEDALGQRLERFLPERFRAAHKQHVENFGQTHVTRRSMGALGALFGLRADGEEFPIEASISQIIAEGKKFYTVILRDITERKRSEEALKEQGRILDLAPVLIRDLSGRILFWNTGAEQMYGWTSQEALEQITHSLLKTEFPRPIEEIKARLYARGHWEGELIHTTREGNRIVVASHWVLHKDEQGTPRAVLEVNNDITERRRAEEEVRRLNAELEQRVADRTAQLQAANKELEAFSYSVSHDLRAPLRHINGFSQALLEDYADSLDATGKGYLQEVREASQEMAQLIDDVLQLARVTRTEMRKEVVDLSKVALEVGHDLEKVNPDHKVKFQVEKGLTTVGDKRLLKIVLTNLIGNAWKFTAKTPQPAIVFAREEENGEPAYVVRDNGAGFDMAYVDKLFGAFQRLHTAGEFEGTGIGLATVQRIINRHGGKVWAAGSVNQGASFYFKLPDMKERDNGE
jgi:PAS domain S-box-containing protein